ncbi:hypothetical protein MGG_17837 [Pyricularia oryzae 70-15]|uniref:Uncharacterized protein n=3 Tax=Pyricularia oryzae TaxID=318829 RepID=G4NIG4_PYRO7|nr:uncharacterized protein MGG_17837 [Pyricularia oryzae 70-15]EHA48024.1 hypothetical protein MGG_17837 [Pyricularia oryzae 70-15]ELQ45098.1 hypothetical protein OOU_Y34scaffold00021g38 [Pyricularia oryzae Y34]
MTMNIKTLPRSTVSLTCLLLDSNISWAVRGPLISRGRPPSKTKSRLVLRMFDLVIISDRLSLSMPRDSQASQANVGRG